MSPEVYCSTIIPTIGRESLHRSVRSVLAQSVDSLRFEVIVVNDSGRPLPRADWMRAENVRLIETMSRNRSVARNAGAAIARGRYLHFLDDDDYLLADAFRYLTKVAGSTSAAWIYGGYRLVSRDGQPLEVCRPDEEGNCAVRFAVGEWLPLQVSLIDADAFFEVGGFASLESLLGGDEDVDLARQISLKYDIEGTRRLVAVIEFGHQGSTTNYTHLHEQSRISREKMLDFPGASHRLLTSARSRSKHRDYWHGRLVWCYLASVYWNLRHRRPITATSRMFFAIGMFLASLTHIFSSRFWLGVAGRQLIAGWLRTENQ